MLCASTMREEQRAAAAIYRAEHADRPAAGDLNQKRRDMQAYLLKQNAARKRPRPLCDKCGAICGESDVDWLFAHLCSTCGARRLERLIRRIIRRRGRQWIIKKLRRLGGK